MLKSTVDQYFKTPDGKRLGIMRRDFKVDFIPVLHVSLEDIAWKKEKKINEIIINPIGGYYMLRVDDEILDGVDSFNETAKMYETHGWVRI